MQWHEKQQIQYKIWGGGGGGRGVLSNQRYDDDELV